MLKTLLGKPSNNSATHPDIDMNNIPAHVAIIMDGNGRWAKRFGMPRTMGHRAGAEVLKKIVRAAKELNVKALTVYGFSTENWKRPAAEVTVLMNLIKEYLMGNVKEMHAEGVRIRFIGYMPALSEELQMIIHEAEELTKDNTEITLQLAINYGGRDEITRATKEIIKEVQAGQLPLEAVTEDVITSHLDTKEFGEVDLLIRPSSDYRISNFLLWQLAYAEFWFTDKHWPEFTKDTLVEAISAYQKRERRFGGLKDEE